MAKPNFKIEDDDLYLGHDVWLRWTVDGQGVRTGGLIIHKLEPGRYCWGSISLKNDPDAGPGKRDFWECNGDWDRPTLTPSVKCKAGCAPELHGYVTDGKWVPC